MDFIKIAPIKKYLSDKGIKISSEVIKLLNDAIFEILDVSVANTVGDNRRIIRTEDFSFNPDTLIFNK